MSEWISVKDRLPDVWGSVLVATVGPEIIWDERVKPAGLCVAYLYRYSTGDVRFKADVNDKSLDVTHWMPLPEPPKDTE